MFVVYFNILLVLRAPVIPAPKLDIICCVRACLVTGTIVARAICHRFKLSLSLSET
jgi:hypothetical protein